MAVQVTVDGKTYRTDDLTLDETVAIEVECDTSWLTINPIMSAQHARAIIVAFLRRDRSPEDAAKFAGALTIRETLEAIEKADDDLPVEFEDGIPKVGEGTETTGS